MKKLAQLRGLKKSLDSGINPVDQIQEVHKPNLDTLLVNHSQHESIAAQRQREMEQRLFETKIEAIRNPLHFLLEDADRLTDT